MFSTRHIPPKMPDTVSGTSEKVTYKSYYDERGVLCLKPDGKINTYDEIQSHKDSCDIYAMIAKCKMLGDTSPLQQRQGMYGDYVGSPATMAEALNMVEQGKQEFMSLPLEVRAKFGHDYLRYISTAGSSQWYDNMADLLPRKARPDVITQPVEPVAHTDDVGGEINES